jgi:hypothetical protein
MGKRWIFALTVALALGLLGLLAYTSESVHRVAQPPQSSTEVARPGIVPVPAEREVGPTVNGTGLMLTY